MLLLTLTSQATHPFWNRPLGMPVRTSPMQLRRSLCSGHMRTKSPSLSTRPIPTATRTTVTHGKTVMAQVYSSRSLRCREEKKEWVLGENRPADLIPKEMSISALVLYENCFVTGTILREARWVLFSKEQKP